MVYCQGFSERGTIAAWALLWTGSKKVITNSSGGCRQEAANGMDSLLIMA